ncbi:MAG: UDP-N-acetylmuramoyl-tripeptide--D-alanyl-D-alanine ligase, partial [Candidatus Omnitrophica bacterium]|nr:UDP-N-acetylmuramoyl-tripeptide--D-alanyl-D-alanine ligase [Candidatus Omnitrophota bacterium]
LLADIARPDAAVITNIGPSHLKFLKDLEGVFEAKKEILDFLRKDSVAILNGDDEYLAKVKSGKFRILRFGLGNSNHFRASRISGDRLGIKFTLNGRREFKLNILGPHNVYNALAAIAAGYIFDLSCADINEKLSEFTPADMRMNTKSINGFIVIDDAYNSNPLSMKCAIEAAKSYPAKTKWVISADMLELGEREKDFHALAGELIAKSGFEGLVTFGSLSRHTSMRAVECGMNKDRVWHVLTHDEAADILRKLAKAGDLILIKGSRTMKMERVIEKLKG